MNGPIHVLTIDVITQGLSGACCAYNILGVPTSASGRVEVIDCGGNLIISDGTSLTINPNSTCTCGVVAVEQSTWGAIKSLYAPDQR